MKNLIKNSLVNYYKMTLSICTNYVNQYSQPMAPRKFSKKKPSKICVKEESYHSEINNSNSYYHLSCNPQIHYTIAFIEKNISNIKTITTKNHLFKFFRNTYTDWVPPNGEHINITFEQVFQISQNLGYFRCYNKQKIIWTDNTIYPKNKHTRFN